MSGAWSARGGHGRAVLAAVVIGVLAVVAALLVWAPRAGGHGDADGHGSSHTADPTPTATEGPAGDLAVDLAEAVAIEPPDDASAGNVPQTTLAEAAAAAHEVRSRAEGLGAPRAPIDPADVLTARTAPGGCHPAYGADGQCLPAIPPSLAGHIAQMQAAGLDVSSMPHHWTCGELTTLFSEGIAVRVPGVDPDGIDHDGDGFACEPDG